MICATCAGPTLDDTTGVAGGGIAGGGVASTGSRRGGIEGASANGGGGTSAGVSGGTGGTAGTGASSSSTGAGVGLTSSGAGTSGSTGGSTGSPGGSSSSGGIGGGACNAVDAGMSELGDCTSTSDCDCPYVCNDDPVFGVPICEQACSVSSDCLDLRTACRSGVCTYTFCGPSGGGPNGGANGAPSGICDATDAGDGTCWPSYAPADPDTLPPTPASAFWFCFQGGTASIGSVCSFTRAPAASLCDPGDLCLSATGNPPGQCVPLCDPTSAIATCPDSLSCGAEDLSDNAAPNWGVCFPDGGGCLGNYIDNELSPCGPNAGCGCVAGADIACVSDPAIGANSYFTTTYCERSCTKTSGCPLPYTSCDAQKSCSYDYCGNVASGVGMSALCDAGGSNDGTCSPEYNASGAVAYGLCYQGGPLADEAACDQYATGVSGQCLAGSLCFQTTPTAYQCLPICNPDAGAGACGNGEVCDTSGFNQPPPPDLGICD